jgi:NAD(P)-dependent dehydrogenase (short-subunit alcohol dehydrogenase family)
MSGESSFATYPSLRGRVVVITGGASGIGEAFVRAFAEQGSHVAFLDIQDDAAHSLIEQLTAAGFPAPTYFPCDITKVDLIQATFAKLVEQFGTIDILVNNAGNDTRHSIDEVTSEFWDRTMAINLKSQFFVARAAIPAMQKAQRGSIINMSSISFMIPSTGLPVYVTAKAAIVGMTRTLARELGPHNIRVNAVMPGAIETERQKRLWLTEEYKAEILARQSLKRMIGPEEVARLVLFLASDDSTAITGQNYVIDGGFV